MTKSILLATTAVIFSATGALAQTAPAPSGTVPPQSAVPTPQADSSQQGVLVFTPDFFADQRPNTALDMVSRIPGFSAQDGDGSRGFEGAVGNILINGSRPASKNDTGSNAISRILVAQVERIELIRGGAPGIDMQGFSVVVNVITRSTASTEQIATINGFFFEGGTDRAAGSYQFTRREGERVWGFTLSDGVAINDSNGVGRVVRRDANGAVTRDEGYYDDQTGGGQAVRVNYADAFMGGKIDLTARLGRNDYSQYSLQDG
ncbi:MAG: TonB-dependent receptor plug domain-containing protein, partial [Brevundimonas sp.]|nr:TonB-dependent receptor plug domain-containing protein [Brevundimonas sp.]